MGKHSSSGRVPASRRPSKIESLAPASTTSESPREAVRRKRQSSRIVDPKTRHLRRRRILLTVLGVVIVGVLGTAVAGYAYMQSIGNKLNGAFLADPATQHELTPVSATKPGAPFYMVLMGSDTRAGQPQQRSDTLIIARVDPQNKKIAMISLPRDSRVDIPGFGTTKINAAATYGGPSLVIKTVKQLTGLPITHYVNLDFFGFRDIVDAMGGVWINIPQKIYDRDASAFGSKYATIPKGYQRLDGKLALTYVRARHAFAAGDYARMDNQQTFIKAIAKQALTLSNVFKAPAIINAVASHMSTDMSPEELANLVIQFKGMAPNAIDSATAPSAPKYIGGVSYVLIDDQGLAAMIARMRKGQALTPKSSNGAASTSATPTVTVNPADVPLTIRNGAGVSGLAKQCSDFFTSKGFKISDSGNMNQFVYGRTLIIYQKGKVAQANFVRETLGFGDVIPAAGMYTFKTQIMVVIGKDWKNPLATAARP
jgi:LCP family protein required for cell wall assembly